MALGCHLQALLSCIAQHVSSPVCAACEHSLGARKGLVAAAAVLGANPAEFSTIQGSCCHSLVVHPLAVLLCFWEMGLAAHTLL